jgi:hypothetical protein
MPSFAIWKADFTTTTNYTEVNIFSGSSFKLVSAVAGKGLPEGERRVSGNKGKKLRGSPKEGNPETSVDSTTRTTTN